MLANLVLLLHLTAEKQVGVEAAAWAEAHAA